MSNRRRISRNQKTRIQRDQLDAAVNQAAQTVVHEVLRAAAQPTGVADPRKLGGGIAGPGGPHDQGMTVLDMTDIVHLENLHVATVDAVRVGEGSQQAIFATLSGRINKKTDRVTVGFMFGTDGAAALITELLALADRCGPEMLDDLTRRLGKLWRGKNVDLHWLHAAIGAVIESEQDLQVPGLDMPL